MVHKTSVIEENAHADGIWGVCWATGDEIVTASADDEVKVWQWAEHADKKLTAKAPLKGHQLSVISVDVHPDSHMAVSSSLDSDLIVWNLQSMEVALKITTGPVESWNAAFSPDGKLIATGSHRGAVNLYSAATGQLSGSLEPNTNAMVFTVRFSPNGQFLACGAHDGTVAVFDVSAMRLLHKLEGHSMTVRALAFSPDSTLLLTGSDDGYIKLYDVAHANMIATFSGHASWVLSLDFSPSGATFASASSDTKVKVWDLSLRQCLHTFDTHTEQVCGVRYSPSGDRLVSVGDDARICVHECTK